MTMATRKKPNPPPVEEASDGSVVPELRDAVPHDDRGGEAPAQLPDPVPEDQAQAGEGTAGGAEAGERPAGESKAARLTRLAAEIDELLGRAALRQSDFDDLVARLKAEEGLKARFDSGAYHIRMAGIAGSSTVSTAYALTSWANAARRWVRDVVGDR